MALDSKNNIKSVFIVPSAAQVAAGTRVTPGSLPTGSVVITNMSNVVLATGAGAGTGVQNYSTIKIIKDRGASLPLQQVVLNLATIQTSTAVSGAPASEQVDFIGYNGTNTNSIQELSNNFYTVKLEHVPNQFAYGKRPANYKYGTYQSGIAATKQQIANGLTASLVQNFRPNRTTDWRVFSEVMTNATRSAAGTGAGTLTFTKYSKSVVPTLAAATSLCTAGTYISIATGLTTPVYKVAARNSTTGVLTLEVPYNGETISGTAAGTSLTAISVSDAATVGNLWGIKITGIKQKYDVNRWRQYDKVRFNTFLEGFPAVANPTAVTTTAAFDGIAVYEQVANDEYISWGDEGQVFVDQVPPLFREQDATNTQYSPAVIGWLDKLPSLIGSGENKGQVILYFPGALVSGVFTPAATSTQSDFVAVFNSWRAGSLPAAAWPDVVA
jgi:hypothetical protein